MKSVKAETTFQIFLILMIMVCLAIIVGIHFYGIYVLAQAGHYKIAVLMILASVLNSFSNQLGKSLSSKE